MVTAASAQGSAKLQGKDFIFIAIFGLLLFIVFFVFAMVLGMNANTFWFTHAIGAIPGGIVWMYLAARVPKPGATAIMSIIVAIVGLLLGMLWTGPAGIVVGGALAEIVMAAGKRSKVAVIAASRRSRCGRCASGSDRSRWCFSQAVPTSTWWSSRA